MSETGLLGEAREAVIGAHDASPSLVRDVRHALARKATKLGKELP